jgi:hypothetical protein
LTEKTAKFSLGPRSTGNANVARGHDHELAGRKIVSMVLQRFIQVLDLGLQLGPREV